jgi:hypothetical protein
MRKAYIYLFIYFAVILIHSLAGKPQQLLPITAAPIVIQKQFTRYTKHTQQPILEQQLQSLHLPKSSMSMEISLNFERNYNLYTHFSMSGDPQHRMYFLMLKYSTLKEDS